MRRSVIVFALVLLAGALLAWLMKQEQGYLLLVIGQTTIEMNLWAAIMAVVLIWFAIRLLIKLFASLQFLGRWRQVRENRGRAYTARGMLYFVEGRWDQAQKLLLKGASRSEMPMVNYLAAANAAFEEGNTEVAEKLLAQAEGLIRREGLSHGGGFAISVTRARLHMKVGRYEEALAILNRLHRHSPGHKFTLKLLEQAYRGLNDWDNLQALLADLHRHKVYSKEQIAELEIEVYSRLVASRAQRAARLNTHEAREALLTLWDGLPSHVKRSPSAVVSFADYLQQLGEGDHAEKLLRKTLNNHWDDKLVRSYGLVTIEDTSKQMVVAEAWLRERPNNSELLLALGRLAQRLELWGKARDYLESARKLSGNPETYAELAKLMIHLGERDKSSEYYQQALNHQLTANS